MKWKQFVQLLLLNFLPFRFGSNNEIRYAKRLERFKARVPMTDREIQQQKPPKIYSENSKIEQSQEEEKLPLPAPRNVSSMHQQLADLMQKISDHVIQVAGKNNIIFQHMGHIGDVPNELIDFASAATIPGVKTICEVGFNAGHSAAVFLFSNPLVQMISFDLDTQDWSAAQVNYVSSQFPQRLTYVQGNFKLKVKEYAGANPSVKCDLWSINGDHHHHRGAEFDFEGAALMSAMRSFVLAHDHTNDSVALKEIWHRWEVNKKLRSIYCKSDDSNYRGYSNGWCLGRFIHPAELLKGEKKSAAACKYMVYTVLGAQRWFNDLTVMMVRSLFASIIRNPPTCLVDIFILTDRDNFEAMQPLVDMFGVRLHEMPRNEDGELSSMTKLQVFSIPQIHSYAAVLFVDADILFNIDSLGSFMSKVSNFPNKLHVFRESPTAETFTSFYFSLSAYPVSKEDIATFNAEKISPFNAGIFMFQPTKIMQRHFQNVLDLIAVYPKNATYFFEQSFMNYYFAKNRAVVYTITQEDSTMMANKNDDSKNISALLHFAGAGNPNKLPRMRNYMKNFMQWVDEAIQSRSIANRTVNVAADVNAEEQDTILCGPEMMAASQSQKSVGSRSFHMCMACKYMVYTVLGAKRCFNDLAVMMVRSLFASIIRNPPTCLVDIFILTDRDNFEAMQPLVDMFGVRLHEMPRNEDGELSSMTKLQVFSIPQIHSYAAVLFVDMKIIFNSRNLDSLLSAVACSSDVLHVYRERPTARDFSSKYHGLDAIPLSADEIAAYEADNLSPFTTAVFMFQPTKIMERHFRNVLDLITVYPKNATYFKEQSFMNHYFAKLRSVRYTITADHLAIWRPSDNDSKNSSAMIYFHGGEFHSKLARMKAYVETNLPWINETIHTFPETNNSSSSAGGASECMYGRWVSRQVMEERDYCLLKHLLY
eukprot:gene33619-43449_t